MDFFKDQTTIIIFVLLFMPGFVSTRIYSLLVPSQPRDYAKTLYEVIGYSLFTYAIWSPLLVALYSGFRPWPWPAAALALLVLVITPVLLPILFLKGIRKWLASQIVDPCPSSWDWSFQKNPTAMIIVHLRDGRKIGGTWSGNAFSSSYPEPNDLYLGEVWNVDQTTGQFKNRVKDTRGLFLWGADIEMIEFFESTTS